MCHFFLQDLLVTFFFFFLGLVCISSGSTAAFKAYCAYLLATFLHPLLMAQTFITQKFISIPTALISTIRVPVLILIVPMFLLIKFISVGTCYSGKSTGVNGYLVPKVSRLNICLDFK
jgi:hypothetical protein